MGCAACGAENKATAKFCRVCGAPLAATCPSCGSPYSAGDRFCEECGTAVAPTGTPPTPAVAPVPAAPVAALAAPVAERRITSVLFADLVGFTPLSESRDPEEVRELLSAHFEVARG